MMDDIDPHIESISWNENLVDDETSEEEDLEGVAADDPNKFDALCEGVNNSLALLHESLQDFLDVKDILLQNFLPPSVHMSLSLLSSKLFRSVTDVHEPINELIRLVKIFSTPWEEKSAALKKLHEDFHKKKRQLDVAIRRLNQIDAMTKKVAYEKKILNWEKLYCRVTTSKGHGRRWKYIIDDLKDRAKHGYDVLVRHVDQIEQDITEPFPEVELRTESVAPQMDPIVEEAEDDGHADEESGAEQYSEASESEESIGPETLQSGFSMQVPAVTTVEPPKPEVAEIGLTTHPPLYDTVLYVRCFCPTGVEGRELKCSITHGAQFEKTSRLDFTDEEIAEQVANAPPPKPKGPKRKGAPPPPEEPEEPKPIKCSELRFPLKSRKVGLKEIPPALEPLTVTVHVGPDEEIVGMATVEVEDIEGIEMPEVFQLPDFQMQSELSLPDSIMYTANAKVDAELQLAEPLPVSFPIYPLGGGKAGSELKACGNVPLFFYYRRTYRPRQLNTAVGTPSFRALVYEQVGVDILEHTKENLFPQTVEKYISPMTVMSNTPPPPAMPDDAIPAEEYEAIMASHQNDLDMLQQNYESRLADMQEKINRLENALNSQSSFIIHDDTPEPSKPKNFVYKKEKKSTKKIPRDLRLPKWGETLPDDFYERMALFQEEAEANRMAIGEHIRREESENIEKRLAFQNKAFRGNHSDIVDALKDVTLPALYNPNTGGNVYNPRVHQYFHPTGTTGLRLTQPPSMMSLPPLKNKMSVINLFDIGQSIHNPNQLLQKYMSMKSRRESTHLRSEAPVNTADPSRRQPSQELPGTEGSPA